MHNLQASSMQIILSDQEYRALIRQRERLTARNEELVRSIKAQDEKHHALVNEFTKVKEESLELKMQIKDISKQSLRINRFHLVRQDQLKGDMVKKEQAIATAQREVKEKVPQLQEEVVRLKQELNKKEQQLKQSSQKEAEHRTRVKEFAKIQLNDVRRIDQLRKKVETLEAELKIEKLNNLKFQRILQSKQTELQEQKTLNNTAFTKLKNTLAEEQQKSKELKQRNDDFQLSLARSQAYHEQIEQQLRVAEEERTRYQQEAQGYSTTWNEMRNKILHSPDVSISMSQGKANEYSELRDTLNFSGPASLELLFTTISSIHSTCSKRKAQHQQLQQKCQSLEKETQALATQLQQLKDIVQRGNKSTSSIQSSANSTMMMLDKSFVEVLKEKDSLLHSQNEELMSEKDKVAELKKKYNNKKVILAQKNAQIDKMKQERIKFQDSLKQLSKIG